MTEAIAAALLALTLTGNSARAASPLAAHAREERANPTAAALGADVWFAEDKARHLGMSYAVTAFAYAGARTLGAGQEQALGAAVAGAAIAGIGKEVYDRRQGGPFSFRDLAADALGIVAGVAVVRASR